MSLVSSLSLSLVSLSAAIASPPTPSLSTPLSRRKGDDYEKAKHHDTSWMVTDV
jgi:hypothetical protein